MSSRIAPSPEDALARAPNSSGGLESKAVPKSSEAKKKMFREEPDMSWARVPAAHLKSNVQGKLIKTPSRHRLVPQIGLGLGAKKEADVGVTKAKYYFHGDSTTAAIDNEPRLGGHRGRNYAKALAPLVAEGRGGGKSAGRNQSGAGSKSNKSLVRRTTNNSISSKRTILQTREGSYHGGVERSPTQDSLRKPRRLSKSLSKSLHLGHLPHFHPPDLHFDVVPEFFSLRHGKVKTVTRKGKSYKTDHVTAGQFFRYKVDQWFGSPFKQVAFMLLLFFFQVAIFGVLMAAVADVDASTEGFKVWEGMWVAWTYIADPGTHADEDSNFARASSFIIAWSGILFFAIILGFVVDAIRNQMNVLKEGRSGVVEAGHTLILNHTAKTLQVIREIILANESEGGGVIVVLCEQTKQEAETEIFDHISHSEMKGTRIVVRSGKPHTAVDLMRVSASSARSIISLANDSENCSADKADVFSLRVMLTLVGLPTGLSGHVVCEVLDIDNENLIRMVGAGAVETLVSHDIIGRLMITSVRHPGIASVVDELLGFSGQEFYAHEWPIFTQPGSEVAFGAVQLYFPDAVPIGVITTDGDVVLKPSPGRKFKPGERLVVIAADDDSYNVCRPFQIRARELPPTSKDVPKTEMILVCGWRRDIRDMVLILETTLVAGSEVHMVNEVPVQERDELLERQGLDVSALKSITLVHHYGSTTRRKTFHSVPMAQFSSVLILSDERLEADKLHADSHSIGTLLLLKDIISHRKMLLLRRMFPSENVSKAVQRWNVNDAATCPFVVEVLDHRTEVTMGNDFRVTKQSDFVKSNKTIAQIMAMVSENRAVKVILSELLGAKGTTLALKHAKYYSSVKDGEVCDFFTIARRAQLRAEVAIGYVEIQIEPSPLGRRQTSRTRPTLGAGERGNCGAEEVKSLSRRSVRKKAFQSRKAQTVSHVEQHQIDEHAGGRIHFERGQPVINPSDKNVMREWSRYEIIVLEGDSSLKGDDMDKARKAMKQIDSMVISPSKRAAMRKKLLRQHSQSSGVTREEKEKAAQMLKQYGVNLEEGEQGLHAQRSSPSAMERSMESKVEDGSTWVVQEENFEGEPARASSEGEVLVEEITSPKQHYHHHPREKDVPVQNVPLVSLPMTQTSPGNHVVLDGAHDALQAMHAALASTSPAEREQLQRKLSKVASDCGEGGGGALACISAYVRALNEELSHTLDDPTAAYAL